LINAAGSGGMRGKMNRELRTLPAWKQHLYSTVYMTISLMAATEISYLYCEIISGWSANISMIYLVTVMLISGYCCCYIYGIAASLLSALIIQYLFINQYCVSENGLPDFVLALVIMSAVSMLIRRQISEYERRTADIKQREKELADAEMEKMRANLLRAVSHDLRTPLTGIMGNSELMLENVLPDSENKKILSHIYEDARWLLNMVENLLSITRINVDEMKITTHDEVVEEVVAEALSKIKNRYPDSKIRAAVPDELLIVSMDSMLIEQVIINLVENAILHSESSEPIEILVRSTQYAVIFTIKDYGVGISPDNENCISDNPISNDEHTADAYKGKGIGLSICRTIIAAHHGTLTGRNHGKGAEFIFTLPNEHS
jgi:two-component system sensor histidine kinase KdpD